MTIFDYLPSDYIHDMGVDSVRQLFIRTLPLEYRERSVYNRRKRKLFHCREKLRNQIANSILSDTDYLIIDSMPKSVKKISQQLPIKVTVHLNLLIMI